MSDAIVLDQLGLLLGVLGAFLALFEVYRHKKARIRCRCYGQVVMGGSPYSLPTGLEVTHDGRPVPRLCITKMVLWNSGRDALQGNAVMGGGKQGFSFDFGDDAEVLNATLLKESRPENCESLTWENGTVDYSFQCLNNSDGVAIQVAHTGPRTLPEFRGTIMGSTKGIEPVGLFWRLDSGLSPSSLKDLARKNGSLAKLFNAFWLALKAFIAGMAVISFAFLMLAVFPETFSFLGGPIPEEARWAPMLLGLIYIPPALLILWVHLRSAPAKLLAD